MARVEADAEPRVPVERVDEDRELVDRAADRAAGAGGVLEQEPGRVGAAVEHLSSAGTQRSTPAFKPGAEVRADVEDDAVGLDRAGRVDGRAHRRAALAVDRLVRRREVAEVERVHEHGADPGLGSPLAEAREILLGVLGEAPRARALGEELHRVGADLGRPVERALDPA